MKDRNRRGIESKETHPVLWRMVGTGAERSCESRKRVEGGKKSQRENSVMMALLPQLA